MKKSLLYIVLFLFVGEAMLQFDKWAKVFETNRVVKMAMGLEQTPELTLIESNQFVVDTNDLRVLALGDSYIHGGGINFKDNMSQQLKKLLSQAQLPFKKIWVLDVSKSKANNLDNNVSYFKYAGQFKPNYVLIGYSDNDINGNLEKFDHIQSDSARKKAIHKAKKKSQRTIKKIYNVIYNSMVIHFFMEKTHRQLNANGIIIPGSNFDQLMKNYYNNGKPWKRSQELLKEMITHADSNNTTIIVYKIPHINLLDYPDLFERSDAAIKAFFDQHPSVIYKEGDDVLHGEDASSYMLSKYDGHPNEKAHLKMAQDVFEVIKKKREE